MLGSYILYVEVLVTHVCISINAAKDIIKMSQVVIGRFLYIFRNFPPERNRVELSPKLSSTPRHYYLVAFQATCSSLTLSSRVSLLKDVMMHKRRCGGRAIIGGGK